MSTTENVDPRLVKELAVDEAYQTIEGYKINRRRVVFMINEEKRVGGYGVVRKAQLRASSFLPTWFASRRYGRPQVVAVKEIKLSPLHDASDLKRAFTREVLVWSSLKGHPGVAKFLGFCADFNRKEAWLISPWEPYGNVSEFIRGRELQVPERLSLAYDTIDALVFLHEQDPPVCHGDIKSGNVLVSSECRAVLCDFGLARFYEDSGFGRLETSNAFKGSLRWCSPELFNGLPRTASSDIYAWAWLVWEIMTGELPYEGAQAEYVIIRKIFESPLPQVDGESRLSDCLLVWELMTRCWAVELQQRPTSAMCKTTFEHLPHCPPTPKTADPHTRSAVLLEKLGELESWKGNPKAAFAYFRQALRLHENDGNNRGIASVLRKQAAVASRSSNHVRTLAAASAALEKCSSLQDDIGIADSLFRIGCSFLMENKRAAALLHLQESLKIFRAKGNSVDLAKCLERLGELYRREGLTAEALSALKEAVEIASRCGDRLGEARALIVLGTTHRDLHHLDQATSALQSAQDIAKNIGWEHGLSTCLSRLGNVKVWQGLQADAEELLRESVRVARNSHAVWRLGQALYYLGDCYRKQNRFEEAISVLEESCSIYQNLGRDADPDFAHAAALLADSKSGHGQRKRALVWYDKAIAAYRKSGNDIEISKCLVSKGMIFVEMKRYDAGALHFEASLVINNKLRSEGTGLLDRKRLSGIPKTAINWEIGREASPAYPNVQLLPGRYEETPTPHNSFEDVIDLISQQERCLIPSESSGASSLQVPVPCSYVSL